MKRPKGRSRKATFAFAPAFPPPAQTPPVDLEISRDSHNSLAEAELRPIPAMPIALFSHNPSAEAEIRALRTISNVAIAAGDLLAISSTLDHNFTVIIGDGTQLSRAAYLEAFTSIFKQSAPVCYQRIPENIHISISQPVAAEHGHWTGTLPDGSVTCTGTYMAMWRRANTRWQLRSELFVTLA